MRKRKTNKRLRVDRLSLRPAAPSMGLTPRRETIGTVLTTPALFAFNININLRLNLSIFFLQ